MFWLSPTLLLVITFHQPVGKVTGVCTAEIQISIPFTLSDDLGVKLFTSKPWVHFLQLFINFQMRNLQIYFFHGITRFSVQVTTCTYNIIG